MTKTIREKRAAQCYTEKLHHGYERLFDPSLPADTIAHVETNVKVHLRSLSAGQEESEISGGNEWFRQFLEKEKIRRGIEHLRRSLDGLSGSDEGPGFCDTPSATDLTQRLDQLAQLLETSPSAAASSILSGLTDPKTEQAWRRRLVLAAESTVFSDDQDRQLVHALRTFIDEFRDSNRREDQVAVCSAIRTYVGLIPVSCLECLATILEPGHRASPGIDTVLEIVKMVTRKTAVNPPASEGQHPRLCGQLARLARAHMDPYVLPYGKSAALAMNAILATFGLGNSAARDLISEINVCCPAWFRQQLQRRLRRLLTAWTAKLGDSMIDHEPTSMLRASAEHIWVD